MSSVAIMPPLMFGEPQAASGRAFGWLSPALIGLSAPLVLGMVLFPGVMEHARFALTVLMFALLLVCVAAYVVSVVQPGAVTGVVVHRDVRTLELISDGLLATRTQALAFDEVADLRVGRQYDDDGYAYDAVELRLRSGAAIALPATISAADVAVVRRALGLSAAAVPAPRRR